MIHLVQFVSQLKSRKRPKGAKRPKEPKEPKEPKIKDDFIKFGFRDIAKPVIVLKISDIKKHDKEILLDGFGPIDNYRI